MSIRSKAKRDARKKKAKLPVRSASPGKLVQHASLMDGDGTVFGGAGLRGQEWVIVLEGRTLAGTNSAAMILAMLKHVASARELSGASVRLSYSNHLRDAATAEAMDVGMTLDAYLAQLEAERAERVNTGALGAKLDVESETPRLA